MQGIKKYCENCKEVKGLHNNCPNLTNINMKENKSKCCEECISLSIPYTCTWKGCLCHKDQSEENKCNIKDDWLAQTLKGENYMQCQVHLRDSAQCDRLNRHFCSKQVSDSGIERWEEDIRIRFHAFSIKMTEKSALGELDYKDIESKIVNYWLDIISQAKAEQLEEYKKLQKTCDNVFEEYIQPYVDKKLKEQLEKIVNKIEEKYGKFGTMNGSFGYQGIVMGITAFQSETDKMRDDLITSITSPKEN